MSIENFVEISQLIILILTGAAIPLVLLYIGNRYTDLRQREEKLRSDRIEIYNKILEPFFLLFSTEAVIKGSAKNKREQQKTGVELATEKLLTLEYQDYGFKLSLIGSDAVVIAFNNLMQGFYNLESEEKGLELIKYTAVLLLEVRKSLGNESSQLHPMEMLEWKINDLRTFQKNGAYPQLSEYQPKKKNS